MIAENTEKRSKKKKQTNKQNKCNYKHEYLQSGVFTAKSDLWCNVYRAGISRSEKKSW